MFKAFTWAKFLGDISVVVSIVSSPLVLGFIPAPFAAILAAVGVLVRAVTSAATTSAAGKATVDPPGDKITVADKATAKGAL